jgi:hypothetical protein
MGLSDATSFKFPASCFGLASPSLLTCLHDFAHVSWPNLPNAAVFQGRMLRDELYSMIYVPRLEDSDAARVVPWFPERDRRWLPLCRSSKTGSTRFRAPKRFTNRVSVVAKMFVVCKACIVYIS